VELSIEGTPKGPQASQVNGFEFGIEETPESLETADVTEVEPSAAPF
jgi:hypothetical protein